MSKIALKPNAAGTGVFSLEAPNSNTDRTLNLPDEAGKLLSTGSNDPAEVFKQSNILGTVSESSGVPTGAIIERGSNSNGEFVKYADGTMICNFFKDWGTITSTGRYTDTELPYSATFIAPPSLSALQFADFRDTNFIFYLWTSRIKVDFCGLTLYITQLPKERQWITNFIAFGRWY